MKEIPLSQGKIAVVDDEDYPKLMKHKWCAARTGYGRSYYAVRGERVEGKTRTVLMHREILQAPLGTNIDHIDGDGLNNTKANLRFCTAAENGWNKGVNRQNTSGYKGVFFATRIGRWMAVIRVNGKRIELGRFTSKEAAAEAYNAAAAKFHGTFARLNGIPAEV